MRLKLGRPRLADHASRFDVPVAAPADPAVTFAGVSTLLIEDGESALLFDGFFSRPSLLRVGLGKIAPDETRIASALTRLGLADSETAPAVAAVIPVHSHFDHAMDSAVVARRTGAPLVGGSSTRQIGCGAGLPEDQVHVATPGERTAYGTWTVTFIESEHSPPDRFPGTITEPVVPPVKAAAFKCGEAWSVHAEHPSGRTVLVQGSAGFVAGALDGMRAEVVYLGIGQLGIQDEDYIEAYWMHVVRAVGARHVVLTHWDDFFRSLDEPLRALPYAGDDLDVSVRVLDRLAAADGTTLRFPTLWRREDPWRQSR